VKLHPPSLEFQLVLPVLAGRRGGSELGESGENELNIRHVHRILRREPWLKKTAGLGAATASGGRRPGRMIKISRYDVFAATLGALIVICVALIL